ncbi:hypothetical protein [Streptomyces sp. NPDC008125]|uniref:hypothetical protein n=1 Tax=Streptomyces sp. NPDC008125 TaxID=3364811 RepID=UPI0036E39680
MASSSPAAPACNGPTLPCRGQLDHTGPSAWPGLALSAAIPAARTPHSPEQQIFVGDFSPEDCDDHLIRRLTGDRLLLIGCLRQGLSPAQVHLLALDWLAEAAFASIGDSGWEPVAPPTSNSPGLSTPADALAELLSTLVRRQREHRSRTVDRLTTVIDTGLLTGDLHKMALYHRARCTDNTVRT